ncbi:hypothetical protein HL653_20745 [Sphingomonas sp. AP4-R1]|uniref:DUF6607 family protein n=1 Tax=Sphingomonas sp. AP4-R1 TaxID=2735134 RepID=UPI0014935A8F|nr:DUF6607 family protein [Sphingomonas sp. AP4-R1]QJU59847.1 hypothetical protein HL653_20745 [Sphingomonas sp. AP4-R1]
MTYRILLSIAVLTAPLAAAPAVAQASFAVAPVYGDKAKDRASILAMAGTFKVTFDMRETVPLVAGYKLFEPKLSGGHEVVRVVIDTPDVIGLQHLLVVEGEDKKPMVIKHWRQDWAWQPATVLSYVGRGRWSLLPVSATARKGAWSQTVYQTDDSPRYGGLGRWRYDDGVARWMSDETSRPLARRDATRKPPYDHYIGTNRHALTPTGWVHEQDNAKIGTKDGTRQTFAHEVLLNSYVPASDFPVAAADEYWVKTKDYWAAVRADWAQAVARNKGLTLGEDADAGSVTGHQLMLLADDIASGEAKADEAKAEAAKLIQEASSQRP